MADIYKPTPSSPSIQVPGHAPLSCTDKSAPATAEPAAKLRKQKFFCCFFFFKYWCAHRVIQSVDVQNHRFGPLVVGAQEEVGLALAGGRRGLGLIGFVVPHRL